MYEASPDGRTIAGLALLTQDIGRRRRYFRDHTRRAPATADRPEPGTAWAAAGAGAAAAAAADCGPGAPTKLGLRGLQALSGSEGTDPRLRRTELLQARQGSRCLAHWTGATPETPCVALCPRRMKLETGEVGQNCHWHFELRATWSAMALEAVDGLVPLAGALGEQMDKASGHCRGGSTPGLPPVAHR
mmetsp:Transcript_52210/g.114612  ORF Transcript_52210/g.114612 Transcript_52210/m.114612 type:complete len:189 (+) Transcript_52210:117-683(+)